MATVNLVPLSNYWRGKSSKYRPMPPPIFQDGPATEEDIELARELFKALDEESQAWYRSWGFRLFDEGI